MWPSQANKGKDLGVLKKEDPQKPSEPQQSPKPLSPESTDTKGRDRTAWGQNSLFYSVGEFTGVTQDLGSGILSLGLTSVKAA